MPQKGGVSLATKESIYNIVNLTSTNGYNEHNTKQHHWSLLIQDYCLDTLRGLRDVSKCSFKVSTFSRKQAKC